MIWPVDRKDIAMKTKYELKLSTVLAGLAMLLCFCSIMSCDDDNDTDDRKPYTFSGDADGSQVVPGVTGAGEASMKGTYSPETGLMTYDSEWRGLTGAPTTGGFYNGASGSTGTIMGTPWVFGDSLTTNGTTKGSMTIIAEQAEELKSGNWYYVYGTAANPNGEVRGQITAKKMD